MDAAQPYNTYSAIKINDLSSQENTRRKLKCILVSERSPSKRATDYDSKYMPPGKGKTMEAV